MQNTIKPCPNIYLHTFLSPNSYFAQPMYISLIEPDVEFYVFDVDHRRVGCGCRGLSVLDRRDTEFRVGTSFLLWPDPGFIVVVRSCTAPYDYASGGSFTFPICTVKSPRIQSPFLTFPSIARSGVAPPIYLNGTKMMPHLCHIAASC